MKIQLILTGGLLCFVAAQSFIDRRARPETTIPALFPQLSDYHIYTGHPSDLMEANGFIKYELATTLFTDYAEKQRLIKVPSGSALGVTNGGLPQFPDGTILVKTFFYWNDARDTSKGKRIIETRILVKSGGGWQAGTYVWNAGQNEAALVNAGMKMKVDRIDENGEQKSIRYQVPSAGQCGSCHNAGNALAPIGFKIRNLNIDVDRNNTAINQLKYFTRIGIAANIDPSLFPALPVWNSDVYTLEQRARAYLEINCAHCHNEKGFCATSDFRPAYENAFSQTNIAAKKNKILRFLKSGRMPLLGTTVVHREGVQLIEAYLKTIR